MNKRQGWPDDMPRMGVAFVLEKEIVLVKNEPYGEGKSFQRMLDEWSKNV